MKVSYQSICSIILGVSLSGCNPFTSFESFDSLLSKKELFDSSQVSIVSDKEMANIYSNQKDSYNFKQGPNLVVCSSVNEEKYAKHITGKSGYNYLISQRPYFVNEDGLSCIKGELFLVKEK